jgi:tetratricopeptide (TPR) repeat protein
VAPFSAAGAKEQTAPVRVNSLSGAYLAARVAEVDNDLASAISYYQRALAFDPGDQAIKQSLMVALIANGDFDKALPYAEQLKEVPDVERFSRVALAIDAFRKKDYGKAEHWLKLAIESDLDRLITGLMTAWAKSGSGDAQGALKHAADLKGPPWFDLFVNYHKALIAEQAGDSEAALAAYETIMGNPAAAGAAPETFLRASEAYAGYLARTGEKEKALEVLDQSDELYPGRVQLAALRRQIDAGYKISPLVATPVHGASEVLLNLGSALNRGGGESFVRLYLRMALALRPDSDSALVQLAGVAEQMRNSEEAIALYEKIPQNSPIRKVAELQLGLNLADMERKDEAIVHLKRVLERDPDDMRAYLALGGVYQAQKEYRAAADIYDQAVARIEKPTRNDWNVFYQRGIAYERLKQWEKAEPNFHKALELYPDHPQVLNYLGYSWVDMNIRLEEGLELIRKAVELRPSDGYIVDSLGWAYYRLGRYEDAVKELERAVSLMPGDPILNDHLGDAYWRAGRKLEATFQWSHARDLDPEPDVLAEVEKKLAEGLPPEREPAVANDPAPVQQVPIPSTGDDRTQAEPETQIAADGTTYTVRPGQSLWSIAAEVLGDGNRYGELLELNPELRGQPGRIVPGQSLRLPPAN